MQKEELLNLPHIHKEINTCTDDNLNMICEKLNRIYELSYIHLWDFYFDNNQKELSQKIYIKKEIDDNILEKYCGIIINEQHLKNFEEVLEETKKETLKNNPIMLHMYRKLFPWDINYMQEKVPDYFIHKAMAIDINEKEILFTDGYCNKFNEYLSIDICKKSCNNKITKIQIKEKIDVNIIQVFEDFKQRRNTSMFENLEKFSSFLININEIEELKKYKKELYKYSPMFNSINKITRSRKKTQKLIQMLGNELKNGKLTILSKEFDKSISYWEYINLQFARYAIDFNKKTLDKISRYINEIIKIEKDLYNKLKEIDI